MSKKTLDNSVICSFCGDCDRPPERFFSSSRIQSFTKRNVHSYDVSVKTDNTLDYQYYGCKIRTVNIINPYFELNIRHQSRMTLCSNCYMHYLSDRMWMLKEKRSRPVSKTVSSRRK
jgi:hypothetical protein